MISALNDLCLNHVFILELITFRVFVVCIFCDVQTAPIRIPVRGHRKSKGSLASRPSMEMGAVGRSQRSHRPMQSRFGSNRDYAAKHSALRQHRPKVEEAPNRALPSLPPPGSGRNASNSIHSAVSGMGSSLKRMFMTPGTGISGFCQIA